MSDPQDTAAGPLRSDFRLGAVRVHPDRLLIERDGGEVRVEPRVMEMLVLLAASDGRTVSRDELRERLWDAYVSDDAIHRAVFKLRRSLGPHAELIETVPKRGYRTTRPVLRSVAGDRGDTRAPAIDGGIAPAPCVEEADAMAPTDRAARSSTSWPPAARLAVMLLVAIAAIVAVLRAVRPGSDDPGRDTAAVAAESGTPDDDTTTFAPFTAMSGYESHPSIDSSSGAVVFANFPKQGDDAFQWDLWRQSLEGGEPRRLTATPQHELNPAVSPSGRLIAYTRLEGDRCGVIVWDLEAGAETAVTGGCGASRGPMDCCTELAWRDEERLLVTRRDEADDPSRIYEVAWRNGTERLLTDPPAQWYGDTAMAVSHDRQQLAVVRRRAPEIADLFLLRLADGATRQLTADGYPISGATWSTDDRAIVFARNFTGTTSLWRLDLADGKLSPLPTIGMNASGPVTAAGVLLYEEWKSEINVWQVDLVDGMMEPKLVSTRWDWRAQPSPAGDRIAFVSNRAGADELWLADADGDNARRLTSLEAGIASPPAWSPDGSRIVISAPIGGSLDIVSVDPVSGAIDPLVADASDEREPVFCGDGDHLFFASNRTGQWDIWRLQLSNGDTVRWTDNGGAAARPAIDGSGVWFVPADGAGLWWRRGPQDPAELVDADFRPSAPSDWIVRADGIYYLRFDEQHTGWLARFEPVSGKHQVVRLLEGEGGVQEMLAGGGLWVSPDGRRALLSSVDLSHSDLWIGTDR